MCLRAPTVVSPCSARRSRYIRPPAHASQHRTPFLHPYLHSPGEITVPTSPRTVHQTPVQQELRRRLSPDDCVRKKRTGLTRRSRNRRRLLPYGGRVVSKRPARKTGNINTGWKLLPGHQRGHQHWPLTTCASSFTKNEAASNPGRFSLQRNPARPMTKTQPLHNEERNNPPRFVTLPLVCLSVQFMGDNCGKRDGPVTRDMPCLPRFRGHGG